MALGRGAFVQVTAFLANGRIPISASAARSQVLDLHGGILDLHFHDATTEQCRGHGRVANVTLPVSSLTEAHVIESQQ